MKRMICLFVVALMMVFPVAALNEETSISGAQINYDDVLCLIDEGDYLGVAEMLIEGSFSETLYIQFMGEYADVINAVLLDAMIVYGETDNVQSIATLRLNGYIGDDLFVAYWQAMNSDIPSAEMLASTDLEIDSYLLYELCEAYYRNDYAIRGFMDLRADGMLNDAMHMALIEKLGFDYTNERYLDENGIAPMRILSLEEREVYEKILDCIDRGDCMSIAQMLLSGEATAGVYTYLMRVEADIMEFVIADGLGHSRTVLYSLKWNEKCMNMSLHFWISET